MMYKAVQFSVFLANRAGVLSQIFREMARSKVNIEALALMDAAEHGVLRMIAEAPDEARVVLRTLNVPVTETDVLSVPLPNKPGAVADVCDKLAASKVNVSYLYCTTGGRGSKATAIFKVPDIKKAMKVLENHRDSRRDMKVKLRRPPSGARR